MPLALTRAGPICAACGYHLRGLPTHGRCPECGEHYWSSTPEPAPGIRRDLIIARKWIWAAILDSVPSFWTIAVTLFVLGATAIVVCLGIIGFNRILYFWWD